MRPLLLALCLTIAATAIVAQTELPATVRGHYEKLKAEAGVEMTVSMQPLEGAPATYSVKLSKPNRFVIEGGGIKLLSDGTKVYSYSKATNTYTEEDLTNLTTLALDPRLWVWAPFFDAPIFVNLSAAMPGKPKTVRGLPVREVFTEFGNGRKATFYMDEVLGFARGAKITMPGGGSYIAFATQVEKKTFEADDPSFKFVPPTGAKKSAVSATGASVRFAQIAPILRANCLPCHSSAQRRGGVDLSSYAGAARTVRPGNPNASRMIEYVTGKRQPRMPMGRAPLSQADISRLSAWIKAGAKN